MVILVDSREQNPLPFDNEYITDVRVTTLDVGDYGVEFKNGKIPPIYFERKSKADLFSTLGKGYVRFKKEIERSLASNVKLFLIVDAPISSVMRGVAYSEKDGTVLLNQMMTLFVRYNITPVFCRNPIECSEYITRFFMAIGRNYANVEDYSITSHTQLYRGFLNF